MRYFISPVLVLLAMFSIAAPHHHYTKVPASWYGPGLYGNKLGCGGHLYPSTVGVAHKWLHCGTKIVICAKRCMTVRVIDRGPYVGGRVFDLTRPVKDRIGFGSTGNVWWRYAH